MKVLAVDDVGGIEVTTWHAADAWVTEVLDVRERVVLHRQTHASEDDARRVHAKLVADARDGTITPVPIL